MLIFQDSLCVSPVSDEGSALEMKIRMRGEDEFSMNSWRTLHAREVSIGAQQGVIQPYFWLFVSNEILVFQKLRKMILHTVNRVWYGCHKWRPATQVLTVKPIRVDRLIPLGCTCKGVTQDGGPHQP